MAEFNQDELIEDEMPQHSAEEIAAARAQAERAVKLGEAMVRLYENEDFKLLFQDVYIDAFAITNVMNMGQNTPEVDRRVFEKMKARGHFSDFCHSTIEDYKYASAGLAEIAAAESAQ